MIFNNSVSGEATVAATTTNEMMKLLESFNEMMKDQVSADLEGCIDNLKYDGRGLREEEDISCNFFYDYNYEEEWRLFAWEEAGVQSSVALEFYRENKEAFIGDDYMGEYVEVLAEEYGVGIEENCCLGCYIWVKNPYYVAEVDK